MASEVVAGATGEDKLGEYEHLHAHLIGGLDGLDHALCVILGVSDLDDRRRRSGFDKSIFHFLFPFFQIWLFDAVIRTLCAPRCSS